MGAPRTGAPIVVVGGGTAGCTVVSHLAARTACDIVLIEPGPTSAMDDVRGFFDVLAQDGVVSEHDATVVRGRPPRRYLEGRALGGGSAVNGMVLSGATPPELEGLTRLARREETGVVGTALLAAGGEPSRLWWNGGRWNPGRAVAHLVEEGRITRVVDEVTSLVRRDGALVVGTGRDEVVASDVVLCAGAIGTPLLLRSSRIVGPEVPVGHGLQTHPMVSFVLHRLSPVPAELSGFDATTVMRTETDNGRAALIIGYERASRADAHLGLLSVIVMEVESRGSVRPVGTGAGIDFNCLDTPGDRRAMVSAVRSLIDVASSPALSGAVADVSVDAAGTPVSALAGMDDTALEEWVLAHVEAASHATSSCAGAVDASGRLHGADGLWVADASVLDRAPACTPAGPVTMEARRVARCIEGAVAGTAG